MTEEQELLMKEAIIASEDIRSKLSKVRIKVSGKTSPALVTAVERIFGSSYITDKGDTYITYDMYCSVVNLIRALGSTTAEETL